MKFIPNNTCFGTMPFGEFLGLTSDFIPIETRLGDFPTVKRLCDEAAKKSPTSLWHALSSETLLKALSEDEAARMVTLRFHGDTANVHVHDAETDQQIGFLVTGIAQQIFERWHQENG